jgi:predicted transposase YbfD/YdcC
MPSQDHAPHRTFLEKWALLSVTQPLSRPVHSNDREYLASTGTAKLGWRHWRREVYYGLSGQASLCSEQIQTHWKRGLWLYKGIPQIGDALMDLAPRSLLHERGIVVDLISEAHICELFEGDPWFNQVFSSNNSIDAENYDFVIVPSYKRRSLGQKTGALAKLPWIVMHGFFTGPEFNRGDFAAQRLSDAMGAELCIDQIACHARQKLRPLIQLTGNDLEVDASQFKVAFAIGGVDPKRTYAHWHHVAQLLSCDTHLRITLLGSADALHTARQFEKNYSGQVVNLVGQTSLAQCRELIARQDLLLACDGGLMHLGLTTATPLLPLFTQSVSPVWRLPAWAQTHALQSSSDAVDDIDATEVAAAALLLLLSNR